MRQQVNQEMADHFVAGRIGLPDDIGSFLGDPEAVIRQLFACRYKRAGKIAGDISHVYEAQNGLCRFCRPFQRRFAARHCVFIARACSIHRRPQAVVVRAFMRDDGEIAFFGENCIRYKAVPRLTERNTFVIDGGFLRHGHFLIEQM